MTDKIAGTLHAKFATREAAERAVEHLVQQHGIDRTNIVVQPVGSWNTAGTAPSGGDTASTHVGDEARDDGAFNGEIEVTTEVSADQIYAVRRTLTEVGGGDVRAS